MNDDLLTQFQRAGDDLMRAGLVTPGIGNLSIWKPEGIVITREGAALHRLAHRDLIQVGRSTEPPTAVPSRDIVIHRAIYVSVQARAVVFARPRHAIAITEEQAQFVPPDLDGAHLLGTVPVVSPKRSVVQLLAEAITRAPVVVVHGHGCYVRADSLEEAVSLACALESSAAIAWLRASYTPVEHDERSRL